MTLAQAQACGAAATNAAFDVNIFKINGGTAWKIRVTSSDLSINVADAAALAVSQGVAGKIALIEFT
jgi:hypothetical protein